MNVMRKSITPTVRLGTVTHSRFINKQFSSKPTQRTRSAVAVVVVAVAVVCFYPVILFYVNFSRLFALQFINTLRMNKKNYKSYTFFHFRHFLERSGCNNVHFSFFVFSISCIFMGKIAINHFHSVR